MKIVKELMIETNKRIPYSYKKNEKECHGLHFSIKTIRKVVKPEEINENTIYLKLEITQDKNKVKHINLIDLKSEFKRSDIEEIKNNHAEIIKQYTKGELCF